LNELPLGVLISIFREAGLGRHPKLVEFLEKPLKQLRDFQIEGDIKVLQQSGLTREIVALAVMGIQIAFAFDNLQGTFGQKRARQREQRVLLGPIAFLTKLGSEWGEAAKAMPSEMFPGPVVVANGLQQYAEMLNWRERIKGFAGVDALLDLAKYAFAGLARRVTGTYHDREISALIGAALPSTDYHMEAHRSWRKRAYDRLDKTVPFAAVAFEAVNAVLLE